jgi:hypothetical protein
MDRSCSPLLREDTGPFILDGMTRSERIRVLLTLFPGLKPKGIERLLAERGVPVDANLIGVARLRHRRDRQAERALFRLLANLLDKRPDLIHALCDSFDDLIGRVAQIAAAHPGLPEDELVSLLETELTPLTPKVTGSARLSRAFFAVLDQQPDYRRAVELRAGLAPGGIKWVAFKTDHLSDDLTDAQMEAIALKYLEEQFPLGSSAEAVARAYLVIAQRRAEQGEVERQQVVQAEADRASRVLATVLNKLRVPVADPEAAFAVVHQFTVDFADWTDEDIADRIAEGLQHQSQKEEPQVQHIEGLTIRART